jgi:hypothetical protein
VSNRAYRSVLDGHHAREAEHRRAVAEADDIERRHARVALLVIALLGVAVALLTVFGG